MLYILSSVFFFSGIISFDQIIYGILSPLLVLSIILTVAPIVLFTNFYYLMVCFYFKYRIQNYSHNFSDILSNSLLFRRKVFDKIVLDHNNLCLDIKNHNNYWKIVMFFMCYTTIPFNAIILNVILFSKSSLFVKICISIALSTLLLLFLINIIISDINIEISNTYKHLNSILLTYKYKYKLGFKLKVF